MSINTNNKAVKVGAFKALAQELNGNIPAKVSELDNDAGYQTQEQVTTAVASAVAAMDHLTRRKVDSVDDIDLTAEDAAKYIYMVPKGAGKNENKYDEYMVLDGELEKVGDTEMSLEGYAKTEDVVAREEGKVLSSNDFTDEDKAKLDGIEFATDEEVAAMLAEVFGKSDE